MPLSAFEIGRLHGLLTLLNRNAAHSSDVRLLPDDKIALAKVLRTALLDAAPNGSATGSSPIGLDLAPRRAGSYLF